MRKYYESPQSRLSREADKILKRNPAAKIKPKNSERGLRWRNMHSSGAAGPCVRIDPATGEIIAGVSPKPKLKIKWNFEKRASSEAHRAERAIGKITTWSESDG